MVESNVNENGASTEIKTGCMKWYIFNDDGDNYTMILDHNTTARITWNDDNKNVSYEESNLYEVVEDLKETNGWKVNPRLITAEEVNTITGKTDFDSTSTKSWYYLDTLTQTGDTFTETKISRYNWLYNNLNKCKTGNTNYGCDIEDNNIYPYYATTEYGITWGYWTFSTVGTSGTGAYIWVIGTDNVLRSSHAGNMSNGIRPVITISKSIIG